jgi:hypothetical protein
VGGVVFGVRGGFLVSLVVGRLRVVWRVPHRPIRFASCCRPPDSNAIERYEAWVSYDERPSSVWWFLFALPNVGMDAHEESRRGENPKCRPN